MCLCFCYSTSLASPVSIEYRQWLPEISAKGHYPSSYWQGDIRLGRDLGYRNAQVPELAARWVLNRNNYLSGTFFQSEFRGKAHRQDRLVLGGIIPKEVTTDIRSKLNLEYWKVGWHSRIAETGAVKLFSVLNLNHAALRGAGEVDSTMSGNSIYHFAGADHWSYTAPTLGLVLAVQLTPRLKLTAEQAGLYSAAGGGTGFADFDTGIEYRLKEQGLQLTVGYRSIRYFSHWEGGSQLTNFKLAGWRLGIKKQY